MQRETLIRGFMHPALQNPHVPEMGHDTYTPLTVSLDETGRCTIPAPVRRKLGVDEAGARVRLLVRAEHDVRTVERETDGCDGTEVVLRAEY